MKQNNSKITNSQCLYAISLGPGDPELITVKAQNKLLQVTDIFYFCKKPKQSKALQTIEYLINTEHKNLHPLTYPTTKLYPNNPLEYRKILDNFYDESAKKIKSLFEIKQSAKVPAKIAVVCEGDSMLYGSICYMVERIKNYINVEIIPGVTGFSAAASAAKVPLCLQDETFTILPGIFTENNTILNIINNQQPLVIYKCASQFTRIKNIILNSPAKKRALLIEQASCQNQKITPLINCKKNTIPYFSLILIPSLVKTNQSQ